MYRSYNLEHIFISPIYRRYPRWNYYRPYRHFYRYNYLPYWYYGNNYADVNQNIYNDGTMYDVDQYSYINQLDESQPVQEQNTINVVESTPSMFTEENVSPVSMPSMSHPLEGA